MTVYDKIMKQWHAVSIWISYAIWTPADSLLRNEVNEAQLELVGQWPEHISVHFFSNAKPHSSIASRSHIYLNQLRPSDAYMRQ